MINMVMLVGRIASDTEYVERDNGNKYLKITLAVNRKFKAADGTYHTDFIDCILWNNFAVNVNNYCSKGDLIGIRGRLQVDYVEKDGIKKKYTEVVAENITFLSTKKSNEEKSLDDDSLKE